MTKTEIKTKLKLIKMTKAHNKIIRNKTKIKVNLKLNRNEIKEKQQKHVKKY